MVIDVLFKVWVNMNIINMTVRLGRFSCYTGITLCCLTLCRHRWYHVSTFLISCFIIIWIQQRCSRWRSQPLDHLLLLFHLVYGRNCVVGILYLFNTRFFPEFILCVLALDFTIIYTQRSARTHWVSSISFLHLEKWLLFKLL